MLTDMAPQLANCRAYGLGWGAEERQDEDLTYYRSGLAHPHLNGVLRLRSTKQAGLAVERVTERLAGVPWMWWVGPDSAPGVVDVLAEHGAAKVGEIPVMAIRLDRLADLDSPAGLKIETVDDAEALAEWVHAYSPSFGVDPHLWDDSLRIEAGRPDTARIVRLAGRLDGEVVGTALMLEAYGVAGIYVVTTAEAHRRQGIGAALTSAALRVGQERGLRVGTLQGSEMGEPVYLRMGFETVAKYQLFQLPTP
ncbi:GNAT family N-acetyltransferase [Streptomyces sp. DG2A-72]|uniref:GNAT family N-acetyltransferase n=1 Tax=Streptomyces sp. DG2A-72 TaxID=3051386 RepID=UPI00265BDDCD|nr:GNAT family N-acetyltransferase [Streptomyces sp. DG2A-72]MDO0939072.1 GNAT family N-acetyltransferase [Streptomyces sp. DG2A-72]